MRRSIWKIDDKLQGGNKEMGTKSYSYMNIPKI